MKIFQLAFAVFALPQIALGNIADELTNAGLTTLLDLVVKADLVDTLLSVAPATIFAPTNDAFDELLADPATTKALAADPNLLKNTLLYHVIPNAAIKSTDLAPDQSVPTANGAPVRVQVDQRGVTVNGVKVVKADVKTSAGIVHVVEKVIPTVANDAAVRSSSNGNIADELTNAGLTTLLDLVVKADLVDTLLSVAPATIFAPTNDAFAELLADPATAKALEDDPNLLKNTLLYHVIPNAAIKSTDLAADQSVATATGAPVRVNVYQKYTPVVTVNGVKVVKADVSTSAGIVHVVEKVIPTVAEGDNIAAVLTKDGRFNTLLAAVTAADLAGAVSTTDGLTVFAPTDDAFAKLPAGTVEKLLGDIPTLASILKRHVVPQPLFAEAICWNSYATLQDGESITTELYSLRSGRSYVGKRVKAYTTSSGKLNKAVVVDADLVATNGVIHAIDTVI